MSWVRMHPFIANWPGDGAPPVFEINSDENGTAVIELAWDPQALLAPAIYPDLLRYYSTDVAFSGTMTRDSGGSMSVSIPSQTITLQGNRATWAMPADLWAAYAEETLKTLDSPPTTTFSRNLYYRVRLRPPGATAATVWPSDSVLKGPTASSAPHIGILPLSATPGSQVAPDSAAVQGMGGIPLVPTLWSTLLNTLWRSLPESDPNRRTLMEIFAHPAFTAAPVTMRSAVLKLWLFSGKSRPRIPNLLSRQAVAGSDLTVPVIQKQALKGGKTLVPLLLDLLSIRIHPDLGVFTREDLVDDVLREILDPSGQINQGLAGTCVPTSIQTMLITVNPAEYVRLQVGWLSAEGKAELANGATADVPPGIFQITRYNTTPNVSNAGFWFRTYAEMAFQGAMLKFGQGGAFPAHNGTEASTQAIFVHVFEGGLLQDQTKRALDALFNVNFTASTSAWPTTIPNFAALQQTLTTGLRQALLTRQQQVLFAVYWNNAPSVPVPAGKTPATFFATHAVLATRQDGGRIFFKNPQYAGSAPVPGMLAGGNGANPPRRFEDPPGTLESMTTADLGQWIYWYLSPDAALV